jgi:hypothetical protein
VAAAPRGGHFARCGSGVGNARYSGATAPGPRMRLITAEKGLTVGGLV